MQPASPAMILPSGIKYLPGRGYRVILVARENNLLLRRRETFQTLPDAIAWKTEKMAVLSAWAENEKLRFAKKLHEYARAAMRERIRANEELRTPVYPPQPQTPPAHRVPGFNCAPASSTSSLSAACTRRTA